MPGRPLPTGWGRRSPMSLNECRLANGLEAVTRNEETGGYDVEGEA